MRISWPPNISTMLGAHVDRNNLRFAFISQDVSLCVKSYGQSCDFSFKLSFPGSSESKESACNAGDPGEGNGYPPQYCCLENSMERGAWQATDHGVTKSRAWPSELLTLQFQKQPGNIHLQLKNTIESFTYLLETKDVIPPVIWIMLCVFSFLNSN